MNSNTVLNQFSMEIMKNMIEMLAKQQGEKLDLLLMYAEENDATQKEIKKDIASIDSKIDTIIEKLTKLETDFSELKNESRSTEEKIMLMSSKLSKVEKDVAEEDLDDY